MIFVDASVAVKWFLPEQGTEAAQAILSGSEKLIASALIRIEVAAAITRKLRLGELHVGEAEEACHLWIAALSSGIITISPDEDSIESANELAIQIRHPLQDCLYLALARRVDGTLLTADPKFAERSHDCYAKVERLE
ncbi:MAG: type II toxin-antitoxin system VapC family toxin [Bryobacteraceae bacterium]